MDKQTQDIETLLKEIQQLKFELKAEDSAYQKELEEKDKTIAELKEGLKIGLRFVLEANKNTIQKSEDANKYCCLTSKYKIDL